MPRLGALLASAGVRSLALGRPGRVPARRRRGIARVAAKAALELRNPLVLAGHALAKPPDLLIHPQQHRDHDLATLPEDRLRLGPLHTTRIRRPSVMSPQPTERLPERDRLRLERDPGKGPARTGATTPPRCRLGSRGTVTPAQPPRRAPCFSQPHRRPSARPRAAGRGPCRGLR